MGNIAEGILALRTKENYTCIYFPSLLPSFFYPPVYTPQLLDPKQLPPDTKPNLILEDSLLYILLRELEAEFREVPGIYINNLAQAYPFGSRGGRYEIDSLRYTEINFETHDLKPRILRSIRRSALAVLILQEASAVFSDPATDTTKILDVWGPEITNLIKKLVAQPKEEVATGAPISADLYFLQSIHPHQQLLKVLKNVDLMGKLELAKWVIQDSIIDIVHYNIVNFENL